jgi:hypothetical protein
MNRNLVFSLCFNLVSEAEKAIKLLYHQNDINDFEHTVVSCEFPLIKGDEIPDNIEVAKEENRYALQVLADRYGSKFLSIKNIGVSQNWDTLYRHFKPDDSDVMTCCDVDEIPLESGWVKALGSVLRADDTIGYAAPTLIDNKKVLKNSNYAKPKVVAGHNVYEMIGSCNYGLLGISGRLMNKMGGLEPYHATPIYGNIESVLLTAIKKHGMKWVMLRDYTQEHTNVPILFRQWKNDIIFGIHKNNQISFEEWLILKKNML